MKNEREEMGKKERAKSKEQQMKKKYDIEELRNKIDINIDRVLKYKTLYNIII